MDQVRERARLKEYIGITFNVHLLRHNVRVNIKVILGLIFYILELSLN